MGVSLLKPFFSIIIVCLNPGEKLKVTLDSILMQAFTDYEIIIKDGLSEDDISPVVANSLSIITPPFCHCGLDPASPIHIYRQSDSGIYDAMNQAVTKATGQYIYFLNCGDTLFDEQVLSNVKEYIVNDKSDSQIFYGNIFEQLTKQEVYATPRINRFACYRNLPCHQACFYQRQLLSERPFEIRYKIRADHEHFIWCVLEKGVKAIYIPKIIAAYEGAGFSESKLNRHQSKQEFMEITHRYMTKGEIFRYRLIMLFTLAPLRASLSRSKRFATIYNRIKKFIYQRKSL